MPRSTHTHFISTKDLTSDQKRQMTKSVLCKYFSDLKEREQDLVPVCVGCGNKEDVVSVITKDGLKLLCPECRANIYRRPARKRLCIDLGVKCDWCETFGARKVTNANLYLCADHYREHQKQKRTLKRSRICEKCGSVDGVRKLDGQLLCAEHLKLHRREKKEIHPILKIFIIPLIRT